MATGGQDVQQLDEPDFPDYKVVDSADLDAAIRTGATVGDTPIVSLAATNERIRELLTKPSEPVDEADFGADELQGLALTLRRECERAKGYGLSAVQIGFPARVFYLGLNAGEQRVYVNPSVVSHGRDIETAIEGCLSMPGMLWPVRRWRVITAAWQDLEGKHHQARLSGIAARAYQHELDHLNGVLITDPAAGVSLEAE